MVRRFKGHKDRVTGLVISQDARWLLSSSMDSTVRVWDIPAACCLQVTLKSPPWAILNKATMPTAHIWYMCRHSRCQLHLPS